MSTLPSVIVQVGAFYLVANMSWPFFPPFREMFQEWTRHPVRFLWPFLLYLLLLGILPLCYQIWRGFNSMRQEVRWQVWRYHERQRRKMRARRRALSDIENYASPSAATSAFLAKLPLELRQQIYSEYYEDAVLNISRTVNGLQTRLTASTDSHNPRYNKTGRRYRHIETGLLDLPLTCRQVYAESIGYLYSCNTFRCAHPTDILGLQKEFLQQRFMAITSLRFEFAYFWLLEDHRVGSRQVIKDEWRKVWEVVATLPHLERVVVRLFGAGRRNGRPTGVDYPNDEVGDLIFEPLRLVTRPKQFDVQVSWQVADPTTFEGAPFRFHGVNRTCPRSTDGS